MKYISIAFQLPLARSIRVLRMRVDLDSFSDNDIKRHFRFQNKSQIVDLLSCFQIPVHIKLENGAWVSQINGLNGSQISARFDCDPPSLQEWTAKGPV